MAKKNDWLINQMKEIAELKKRLASDVQEVYACFCKVLIDTYGWSGEEVTSLFARTQELWNEICDSEEMWSMVKWCEDTTNFSVVGGSNEDDVQTE